MPELPEVETTCRGISPCLIGKTIEAVNVYQSKLRHPVPVEITQKCPGQTIQAISRRAKYILIQIPLGTLLIHLGMTGHLRVISKTIPRKKHDHIDLYLTNDKVLRYHDPRKFGSWQWIEGMLSEQHPSLAHLGPEPLAADFTGDYLRKACQNKKQPIKSAIMDNRIVVGVGNIYACESLFLSKIHPLQAAGSLTRKQYDHLAKTIQSVLNQAIAAGGTTLKDFFSPDGKPGYFSQALFVYGRNQLPCLNCQSPIQSLRIGGRSTAFCPSCQSTDKQVNVEICE